MGEVRDMDEDGPNGSPYEMLEKHDQSETNMTMMEQFVCGMPGQEKQLQAHLVDTQIGSVLWDSHQMASGLSQAQTIKHSVCGTP
jgi:hypothetical protein